MRQRLHHPETAIIPDREMVAWAAGLYEGEGSCNAKYGTYKLNGVRRNRKSPQYILQVGSTDYEPLEKFKNAVSFGFVYGPYHHGPNRNKSHYRFSVTGFEDVQAILAMFWPWLSPRRKEQAIRTLKGEVNAI